MRRALVFPGQGAQVVGMGSELAQKYPEARALLDQADRALGFALSDVMANGPEAELTRTDLSQPAILVHSLMALAVLRQVQPGLQCLCTAGLSLGEYTALVAAGALDPLDAVKLVRLRGQAMQAAADAAPGGMVVLIGADEAQAQKVCEAAAQGEVLQVANLNSPGQVVISGAKAACLRSLEAAKAVGLRRAMPLPVAGAFHSPLMAPAAEKLAAALAQVAIRDPQVPVYSNVSAQPVTRAADIPGLLVAQLTAPVRWQQSVTAMAAAGVEAWWELGPGKTLCGMVGRTVAGAQVANLDTPADALKFAGG